MITELTAGMIDYVPDWQARLRGRLAEQFKNKARLQVIIDAFAAQVQALEDSGQALALLARIDPVTDDPDSPLYGVGRGAQLRVIGRIVGQPYANEGDDLYRLRVRARRIVNRSSGSPEELYGVFLALLGGEGSASLTQSQPATAVFVVETPLSHDAASVLLDFLRAAKDAGVRLLVEWFEAAQAADVFAFDPGPGLGFADADDPLTTGGRFASAAHAI